MEAWIVKLIRKLAERWSEDDGAIKNQAWHDRAPIHYQDTYRLFKGEELVQNDWNGDR